MKDEFNVFDFFGGHKEHELPDAPPDVVQLSIDKLYARLEQSNMDKTTAIEAMVPVAARILADVRENKRAAEDARRGATTGVIRKFPKTKKGLTLAGSVGCGKSYAMRCMMKIASCEYVSIPELALSFTSDGAKAIIDQMSSYRSKALIIDDLGAEQKMKSYGQNFPIEEILMERYNVWQSNGVLTHFSTNLNGTDIAERYGERIADRIKEMTEIHVINEKSLRK